MPTLEISFPQWEFGSQMRALFEMKKFREKIF